MKRLALFPLLALALAACSSDPATSPMPGRGPRLALSTIDENAPNGTHIQTGTPGCAVSGLDISCSSYELAGVGNANAQADLHANYSATVDCRNHGKQVVEVKAQVRGASVSTGELEPKNGRLQVPALSTGGDLPSNEEFEDGATCPNGNWTKEVRGGSASLDGFTYTLAFVGFPPSYITITGP